MSQTFAVTLYSLFTAALMFGAGLYFGEWRRHRCAATPFLLMLGGAVIIGGSAAVRSQTDNTGIITFIMVAITLFAIMAWFAQNRREDTES